METLSQGQNVDFPIRSIVDIKSKFLPFFKQLRHDYRDDIPAVFPSIEDPEHGMYKCKTDWFCAVINMLNLVIAQTTDPVHGALVSYYRKIRTYTFGDWQGQRTAAEIDEANRILDITIDYIEKNM